MLYFSKLRIISVIVFTVIFSYFAFSNFLKFDDKFFSKNINLGLDYFIANDENDYYNKALGLIKNYNKIEKIGNNLRNQALASPLLDIQSFSKNFYDKLHEIYTSH